MATTKHTILIICEGENTETLFFNSIRDAIKDHVYNIGEVEINIKPEPIIDENDTEEEANPHKSKRKVRHTKPASFGIEPVEIRAPLPLKWILEAQKELEDGTCNEAWTVFDHDNHPARKEAFEAADKDINGTKVNIAFTSISFEYYLLLHFEQLYKQFKTSECRDKNNVIAAKRKKPIVCGTNKHTDDCHGEYCIGGYARIKNYWTDSKDDNSTFLLIKDNLEIGFENAAWLRFTSDLHESDKQIYDRNPYITTDNIVKRLTGNDHRTWSWLSLDLEYKIGNIDISISSDKKIVIRNTTKSESILVRRNSVSKISSDNIREAFGTQFLISPQSTEFIDVSAHNASWYIFQHDYYSFMFSFNNNTKILSIIDKLLSLSHKELNELYNILKSQIG
jgi:hypothetical protein